MGSSTHFICFLYPVSIWTVALYYTLKYSMHGSPKFRGNYCSAANLKILLARQSIFHQKIVTCHNLKCYLDVSPIIIKIYYRAPYLEILFLTRKYCGAPYLKGTLKLQFLHLYMKIICQRFHIRKSFTFWDMSIWDTWKVCLELFRNNRIC